jgi:hypothetical protein
MAKPVRFGPLSLAQGVFATASGLVLAGAGTALTTPAWSPVNMAANGSIILGVALFFWGIRINGRHLWEPWWRGPHNPFAVNVWTREWDYEEGTEVGGIRWNSAYSHVRVDITNVTEAAIDDVTALLMPDLPIIESRAKCDFAECRIGSAASPPDITVRAVLRSGREVDIPAMPQVHFGPPHRLVCGRLPAGATIKINLATVVPDETDSPSIVQPIRTLPEHIDILLQWQADGDGHSIDRRYSLGNEG